MQEVKHVRVYQMLSESSGHVSLYYSLSKVIIEQREANFDDGVCAVEVPIDTFEGSRVYEKALRDDKAYAENDED